MPEPIPPPLAVDARMVAPRTHPADDLTATLGPAGRWQCLHKDDTPY